MPGGWWHTVLNLDLTVAVTHNYCSSATFPAIWAHARRGRPKMSARWLAQVHSCFAMRQQNPETLQCPKNPKATKKPPEMLKR